MNETFSQPIFLHRFTQEIAKDYPIKAEFKGDKLILHNYSENFGYFLYPTLAKDSGHYPFILKKTSHWGWSKFLPPDESKGQRYVIAIFGDKLEKTTVTNSETL